MLLGLLRIGSGWGTRQRARNVNHKKKRTQQRTQQERERERERFAGMLFAVGNGVKYRPDVKKWEDTKTSTFSDYEINIRNSRDIARALSACPFTTNISTPQRTQNIISNLTPVPEVPLSDFLKELGCAWRYPLYASFFGILQTNTNLVLYSNDFLSCDGFVHKDREFLDDAMCKIRSASVFLRGNEKSQIVELVARQYFHTSVLVIDSVLLLSLPPNVASFTYENFYRDFDPTKRFGIAIIASPQSFNVRSRYATYFASHKIEHVLLLYDQDSLIHHVQLSGVGKLKKAVPRIDIRRYVQHNVMCLEAPPKRENNALNISLYEVGGKPAECVEIAVLQVLLFRFFVYFLEISGNVVQIGKRKICRAEGVALLLFVFCQLL